MDYYSKFFLYTATNKKGNKQFSFAKGTVYSVNSLQPLQTVYGVDFNAVIQ
jgi:hypothetical protein